MRASDAAITPPRQILAATARSYRSLGFGGGDDDFDLVTRAG